MKERLGKMLPFVGRKSKDKRPRQIGGSRFEHIAKVVASEIAGVKTEPKNLLRFPRKP